MKKLYSTLILLLFCSFNLFAQAETEPNDNINQGSNAGNTFTAPVTIGGTTSITVGNNDFFKINLPNCTSWAFNIINPSGQGNVNLKFYNVQNSTTPIINTDFNFNSGLPAPVVFNCGQTIWVQVDQTSGTDIGTYQLQVFQYTNGDTFECNNDYTSATIIPATPISAINSSFSAKLWGYDCDGNPDKDYFTYTPTQCGVLKVIITNQNVSSDLEIKIYDDTSTHNLIASLAINGDFGALLEAGQKYYFVITDGVSGGNFYELYDDPFTVTTSYDISETECNNTFSTATPLPLNNSFDIKLWGQNNQINIPDNRPQDADYFTYTPTQCGVLKVIVTGQNLSSDLQLDVYDDASPTRNLITPLALNGNFGALLEAGQKYYLVITDGVSGGNFYELYDDPFTVTTSYDISETECNNTYTTAIPLPLNTSFDIKLWGQNNQINIPDVRPQDADYFTYTPTQCGVLKVVVTNQNASSDLKLEVYDDATPTKNLITPLALNGDFGALLEAGQKYYLVITDGVSGGNPYELFDDPFTVTTSYDTSDIYECNNTYVTAAPLPIGTSFDIKLWGQNNQINVPDVRPQDADYFTYTPTQCGVLKVVVTNQNTSSDLKFEVWDDATPTKNLITPLALNGDFGALLEAGQKYYLVITDGVSGGNPYELFDDPFTVTTSYDTSDIYECNNTYVTAAPLPIGTSFDIKLWGQNNQINIPDVRPQDADYFYVQPSLCSNLNIVLTNFNLSADLKIEIFKDQLPNPVSVVQSFSNSISVQLQANQKYYIVITDGTSGGNPYELFDDSFTVTTTLTTLAPTPTPIINGTLNLSTPTATGNTYQWYLDSVLIVGATNSTYNVTSIGSYTVCVSNPNTCGTTCSAPKVITTLANDNFEINRIVVHPNPTNSKLNLQVQNGITIDKVIITDITGKKILEQTQSNSQINVESLANGLYLIEAFSEGKKFQTKFVKE